MMKSLKNLGKYINKNTFFMLFGFSIFFIFLSSVSAFDLPIGPGKGHVMPSSPDITSGVTDEGASVITGGIMMIVDVIRTMAASIAVLWLVIMGVQMVTAGGNEEQASKARKGATWSFVALGLILLSEPMVKDVLYGGGKINPGDVLLNEGSINLSISEGTKQIMAILEWGKALMVTVALMFLVLSGWRMIQALGDQETMTNQKQVFLWMGIGFIIIAINDVVINEVIYKVWLGADFKVQFAQDPVKGIAEFAGVIRFALKFVALLAFIAFIWGGGLFLISFGDEERVDTGKKIMKDALIGLIVILISFALVSTLITGQAYQT